VPAPVIQTTLPANAVIPLLLQVSILAQQLGFFRTAAILW